MTLRAFTLVLAGGLALGTGCFLTDKADEDEDEDEDDADVSEGDDGDGGGGDLDDVYVECEGNDWLFEANVYGSVDSVTATVFDRADEFGSVTLGQGAGDQWFGEASSSEIGESCTSASYQGFDVLFRAFVNGSEVDEQTYSGWEEGGDNACNACGA